MIDGIDMLLLARLQFAFTIAFHIIFSSFTIGLASYLALLEGLWLKTGQDVFMRLYRFWIEIFAVSFGMGVVSGMVISTFWILAANSWMHTPAGYELKDGIFYATDWLQVIFNPSFPYRLTHMMLAAYLTTSLVVAAVASWHLLKGTHRQAALIMLKMSVAFLVVVVLLQIIAGHEHGVQVHRDQPVKLAAMEGHWETYESEAPLILFAWPDEAIEDNRGEIALPGLGSLVVTGSFDGAIKGLREWPADERPPVAIVFWAFRLMVGLGMLMLMMGGAGLFAAFPKAYAALMPAIYMPIGLMLTALIFRGVAFEFRFKAEGSARRCCWWAPR